MLFSSSRGSIAGSQSAGTTAHLDASFIRRMVEEIIFFFVGLRLNHKRNVLERSHGI
jgi:hypothetical protein